jgi:hypothetical protein
MGTHSVADAKTKLPRLIDQALGGAMTSPWPNLPPFFEKSVGAGSLRPIQPAIAAQPLSGW